MTELPAPLTAPDCDCTDLDGFMLNVERLMASELVALSTHEEVAAAIFLWSRAWKQRPAASLPDDDKVLAAFARLPLKRFLKVKQNATRGFVKCSDNRLYHKVLSEEATRAYEKKLAFRTKRETEAERLRKWRANKAGNAFHTPDETHDEARFVPEGQGQGQGQGQKERKKEAPAEPAAAPDGAPDGPSDVRSRLFREGLAALGRMIGAPESRLRPFLGKLLKDANEDALRVLRAIEDAERDRVADPRAWLPKAIRSRSGRPTQRNGPSGFVAGKHYDPRYFKPSTREQVIALPKPEEPTSWEFASWFGCQQGDAPETPPGTDIAVRA